MENGCNVKLRGYACFFFFFFTTLKVAVKYNKSRAFEVSTETGLEEMGRGGFFYELLGNYLLGRTIRGAGRM